MHTDLSSMRRSLPRCDGREPERSMADPKETSAANGIHMREAAAIFLAISSLLFCSCADLALPPDQLDSNRHRPGSGDCTFRKGRNWNFGHETSALGESVAASAPSLRLV